MKNIVLVVSTLLILIGCSTIKDAENKLVTAEEHIYDIDFPVIWSNVIDIVKKSDLDLVYADIENGNILAQAPISAFSWGENVYIKIFKVSKTVTILKVSSVRASPTNITAKNWETYIVGELDQTVR